MPDQPEFPFAPPETQADGEPFPCPACGQMLGPGCRVCAACKEPIDPAAIRRFPVAVGPSPFEPSPIPLERARFPWSLFLILLLARLTVSAVINQYLGLRKTFLILGIFEIVCGAWVFYDAVQCRVPKPLRWGLGSALLWILVFPWYLTRRRVPRAACPFIEAEVGPVARALIFALMIFFFLSVVIFIFKGPPPR